MFIGREKELSDLRTKLESAQSEAILIYGRRRVGKTFLIEEALKGNKGNVFRYTFRDVPSKTNVMEFCDAVASFSGNPGLKFADLGTALSHLFALSSAQPIYLVLDEYSYLRRDDSGIDSFFQIAYDKFRYKGIIKLLFCGSYMDIMTKMIEHSSPMYGRFSLIMQLHPFDYYESSLFAHAHSDIEKFEFYSFFGGSGFALSNLDFSISPKENLMRLFLPNESLFEREMDAILSSEVKKVDEAKMVLEGIASGRHKYSDINQLFKLLGGNNVSYVLKKLLEMDLIEKVSYINKSQERNSLYYLKDNLLDFYYTYLFKATDARANLSAKDFMSRIQGDIEKEYLPKKFEMVSKQFLIRSNRLGRIKPPFDSISRYLYNDKAKKLNGEFDLVSQGSSLLVDYECKYKKEVDFADWNVEQEQIKRLGIKFSKVVFITKNGVSKDYPKGESFYSLSDFYR